MLPEVQFRGKKSNHPFIDWKWCARFQSCKNWTFGGKQSLCSPCFVELLRRCCSKELAAVVEEAFRTQRSDFDAVQLPVWFRCLQVRRRGHRCIYEADLPTACCGSFSGWIRCGDLIWPWFLCLSSQQSTPRLLLSPLRNGLCKHGTDLRRSWCLSSLLKACWCPVVDFHTKSCQKVANFFSDTGTAPRTVDSAWKEKVPKRNIHRLDCWFCTCGRSSRNFPRQKLHLGGSWSSHRAT